MNHTMILNTMTNVKVLSLREDLGEDLGNAVYTARVMLNVNPDDDNYKNKSLQQYPKQEAKANSVHLYPNPAKESITIAFDQPITDDGIIEIWNIMGSKLLATTIPKATKQQKVNVSSLSSGIYFYIIKVNNNNLTSDKLIILNK